MSVSISDGVPKYVIQWIPTMEVAAKELIAFSKRHVCYYTCSAILAGDVRPPRRPVPLIAAPVEILWRQNAAGEIPY